MLFRTGISRILDITNDLLSKGKAFLDSTKQDPSVGDAENNSVFLVTDVVESIVSEKRVEFRSKLGIQIVLNFQQSTFGMFAKFQKSELKRILSNLINNSVEAVKEKGRIEINAFLLNGQIHVSVQDNGCGIPEDILPKLLKRGASFNKGENNLGVGLYHASMVSTELAWCDAVTSDDFTGRVHKDWKVDKNTTTRCVVCVCGLRSCLLR
jgi:signal transduction histidine kinase